MSIISESDIVRASNQSQNLARLVTQYLTLFREYANGVNITIPDKDFTVTFLPLTKESFLSISIIYIKTVEHRNYQYYDYDDYNYSEAWGSNNCYGYTTSSSQSLDKMNIDIPFQHLLLSKAAMIDFFKRSKVVHIAKQEQLRKQEKIDKLEKELQKLKSS